MTTGQRRPARADRAKPQEPGVRAAAVPTDRLRAVIEPVLRRAGYELDQLSVARAGRRHLVRVSVDADAGVSLDGVAEVSRQISAALDDDERGAGEIVAGEYVLEVSSPGVDRPLTQPRHWRRNLGRLVAVTADGRAVTGRISAADQDSVTLELTDAAARRTGGNGTTRRYGYAALGPGRIQIEFDRPGEVDGLDDVDDVDLDDGADEVANLTAEAEEDEE